LDRSPDPVETVAHHALTGHDVTGEKTITDDDTSSSLPSPRLDPAQNTNSPLDPSTAVDWEKTLQRLISPAVPQDKHPSLIEAIFSDRGAIDVIDRLRESDAQTFIDVIDGVRHHGIFPERVDLLLFPPPAFCWLGVG